MTQTRSKTVLATLAVALFAVFIASCSGSTTTETGDGPTLPTNTTRVVTTGTRPLSAACTKSEIEKALGGKHPEPQIKDESCTLSYGIATIYPKDGPKKGIVGFFQATTEGWSEMKEAAPDSDLYAEAPPDFPKSLIDEWKRKYVDPTKPSSTTTSSTEPTSDDDDSPTSTSASSSSTTSRPSSSTATSQVTTTTSPPQTQTIIVRG